MSARRIGAVPKQEGDHRLKCQNPHVFKERDDMLSAKNSSYATHPRRDGSSPRLIPHPRARSPFLAALECDFRHSSDGRKWRARCTLKRQVCRGYAKLGLCATERELSRFLGIPTRTVRWGIAILKVQKFLSNVKRIRYNGPMLRALHSEHLRSFRECDLPPPRILPSHSRILPGNFPRC